MSSNGHNTSSVAQGRERVVAFCLKKESPLYSLVEWLTDGTHFSFPTTILHDAEGLLRSHQEGQLMGLVLSPDLALACGDELFSTLRAPTLILLPAAGEDAIAQDSWGALKALTREGVSFLFASRTPYFPDMLSMSLQQVAKELTSSARAREQEGWLRAVRTLYKEELAFLDARGDLREGSLEGVAVSPGQAWEEAVKLEVAREEWRRKVATREASRFVLASRRDQQVQIEPVAQGRYLFGFLARVVSADDATTVDSARRETAGDVEKQDLRGKVLLIDDSPDIAAILHFHLEDTGVILEAVATGKEGVVAASSSHYDLILLDRELPDLQGVDAVKAMRAGGVDTPIIGVSALWPERERSEFLESGGTSLLGKPFKEVDLLKLLKEHLSAVPSDLTEWSTSELLTTDPDALPVIAQYADTLMGRLAVIETALNGEDLPTAAAEIHKLVGSAGLYGFSRLSDFAAELEVLAKEGDGEGVRKFFSHLEKVLQRIALNYGDSTPRD